MDELIGRLASNASIDSAVAEKTVGIILGFLRAKVHRDVQALIDQIPGAEAAIRSVQGGGGLVAADGRRPDGRRRRA